MCVFSKQPQQTVTPVVASTENRAAVYEADMAELERRRRGGVAANILTSQVGVRKKQREQATRVQTPAAATRQLTGGVQ